jgi:hypothetical protein
VSLSVKPVRSGGEGGECPPTTRRTIMPRYLLSTHTVLSVPKELPLRDLAVHEPEDVPSACHGLHTARRPNEGARCPDEYSPVTRVRDLLELGVDALPDLQHRLRPRLNARGTSIDASNPGPPLTVIPLDIRTNEG